jgi:hypothetical protein
MHGSTRVNDELHRQRREAELEARLAELRSGVKDEILSLRVEIGLPPIEPPPVEPVEPPPDPPAEDI